MLAGTLAALAATAVTMVGHSVRGHEIRVVVRDSGQPGETVLVVGCIHGSECAGTAVTRRLLSGSVPSAGRLVVIEDLNPDGRRLGVRTNARGVDLNRNFPSQWRPGGRGPGESGPPPPRGARSGVLGPAAAVGARDALRPQRRVPLPPGRLAVVPPAADRRPRLGPEPA